MTELSEDSHRMLVERVRRAQGFAVDLPLVGRVSVPKPEHLAYYAALGGMAAAELIEWPVAVVIAAGHLLAADSHNRALHDIGEALEEG